MIKTFLNRFNQQIRKIRNTDWKHIIILDACRYDYFKKFFSHYYYVGEYTSPASATIPWLRAVFPDKCDYTIYSTNPNVCGKFKENGWGYYPYQHFEEIVDLFLTDWSKKYGCVPPEVVYERCKDLEHKSIIWFLQPHSPYLSIGSDITVEEFVNWKPEMGFMLMREENEEMDFEKLKLLYENNLLQTIPFVIKLIDSLEKPILITSAHGELLGEYGKYGHPSTLNVPELRKVPICEVYE